jgi:membrane protease YdiL (CAAX protease family)
VREIVIKAPPNALAAAAAWTAGLLAGSGLTVIVWREALHQDGAAFPQLVGAAAAGLLLLGSYLAPSLRRLRLFSVVLMVQTTGFAAVELVAGLPAYRAWALAVPAALSFGVANSAKLVPVALAAALLAAAGQSRGELYLRIGNLRAPAEIPLPVTTRRTTWPRLGIILIVLVGVYLVFHVAVTRHPSSAAVTTLLEYSPVVVVSAAVNTFCEEFLFRNSLIAPLVPAIGRPQAVWLTSLRFGIGHFYGNPSGLIGVVGATLFGFVLGRSMIETGGSGWAWMIHFAEDVVIFALIALTAPALWTP